MSKNDILNNERDPAPLERGFDKLLSPFEIFFKSQSSTGILLLLGTLAALLLVNSDYREAYENIGHLPLSVGLGDWRINRSLHHWVNEGLMVLFFFVLGLEIKREMLVGDLRKIRQSTLVLFMAAGGMVVPAAVYALTTQSGAEIQGWGIPMATDTAFALGALALLGKRAPRSAAVLLSALAIVDDIGAVLIISVFYTEQLDYSALANAGITWLLLFLFNLLGMRRPLFYLLGGVVMWWFVIGSGVHATIAGILAAMAVPARPYAGTGWFKRQMRSLLDRFERLDRSNQSILEEERQHEVVEQVQKVALETTTPLQHWGSALDKPVSFIILPLFAFLNAGVTMPKDLLQTLGSPVMLGTFLGLVLGKGVGISCFAWLALRFGIAKLPGDLQFTQIVGLSLLAGIGFTMSLFIAALAFATQPELLAQAKLGILSASLIAALLGMGIFLKIEARKNV